jgi:hypothetical protein
MSHYWVVPPAWSGDTCYILAGGPSLARVPISRLRNRGHVIVINDSFELAPWAGVLYFCDQRWWDRKKFDVKTRFQGRQLVTLENIIPGVRTLRNSGALGLETDPGALRHGSNSGYQAINLAYHFGARRIILLGYDLRIDGDRTHWHPGHPGQTPAGFGLTLKTMLATFPSLVEPLKEAGVEVLNATEGSALDCFPRVPLTTVM